MSERLEAYHQHRESPYAQKFGRVITAMVTPFRPDGRVHWDNASSLACHLLENGSDTLAIAGTTGESATLSHEEQRELFWRIRGATNDTLLAGTGSNSTDEAVSLSRYVTQRNLADGLLVVSPYYNRPSQYGIEEYFHTVASETDLPIIMYNIPGRTGRAIEHDTITRLAQNHTNIIGLKDAGGSTSDIRNLLTHGDLPEDFVVYSGDDGRNLELAEAGAVGAISVASHWVGSKMQSMYDALDRDDRRAARAINEALQPHYIYESSDDTPNPIPTKTLLHEAKVIESAYTRPPMSAAPETRRALGDRARQLLQ